MKRFVFLLSLLACGQPMPGDPCMGTLYCEGPASGLFCESGRFVRYPCSGPNGCLLDQQRNLATCDVTNSAVGDVCAEFFVGKGFCEAGGAALIRCDKDLVSRAWTRIPCSGGMHCGTLSGGGVGCQ